jgi:threonine/homoserine/homoserine lactone efflux protein
VTAGGLDANLVAYLTFTAILAVTPGATTAVVVRNTLRGGRSAGLATAAGAALANATHATFAGLGLAVLFTHWPSGLVAIRILGAVYLAWLGAQSLWTAFHLHDGGLSFESEGPPLRTGAGGFRDGLAINLANPTIITFYLAIVPSFIPAGAPHFYFATLAAIHVTIAFVCHSMWAVALHAVRRWFAAQWARRTLTAATGLALIYLAARVLT